MPERGFDGYRLSARAFTRIELASLKKGMKEFDGYRLSARAFTKSHERRHTGNSGLTAIAYPRAHSQYEEVCH